MTPKTNTRGHSQNPATSLERALAIFEIAAGSNGGVTNGDLARKLNIPTSSCSYVLARLERAGYLRRDHHRRYELGLKILTLAHSFLTQRGMRMVAEPIVHQLATKTGQSVIVGILDHSQVTLLLKHEQPDVLNMDFEVGAHYPAHATAIGKMLMACLSDAELDRLLKDNELEKHSPKTINSMKQFRNEIGSIRKRGYSTSDGELFAHLRGLAVPIHDSCGEVCAGITLAGSSLSLDDKHAIQAMETAARQISRRLQNVGNPRSSLRCSL